jgi:murein DD-endopeptidase MepM/ murein hydrolase activator NlpD
MSTSPVYLALALFGVAGCGSDDPDSNQTPTSVAPIVVLDATTVRMPFRAGTVAYCQQGAISRVPFTHSVPVRHYAVDLTVGAAGQVEVVAAAAGVVEDTEIGVAPDAPMPGGGLGNYVVVKHEGTFTLYAHLHDVLVRPGDALESGQRLGTVGRSGKAGNAHLHFSMHLGTAWSLSTPTAPFDLLTAPVDERAPIEFASTPVVDLVCDEATFTDGPFYYASENAPGPPRFGEVDADLEAALRTDRRSRPSKIAVWNDVDAVLAQKLGPAKTVADLGAIPPTHPHYLFAQYWIATFAIRDLKDWQLARAALERLDARRQTVREGPDWLVAWTLVRAAQLAEHEQRTERAKTLWKEAIETGYAADDFREMVARARKRLGPL